MEIYFNQILLAIDSKVRDVQLNPGVAIIVKWTI